jgi:hypothetical protein
MKNGIFKLNLKNHKVSKEKLEKIKAGFYIHGII